MKYCGKGMFYENDLQSDMQTTKRRLVSVIQLLFWQRANTYYNFYTSLLLVIFLLEKQTYL